MSTKIERYWHSDDFGWCYRVVLYVRGVEVLAHYNVRPGTESFWAEQLRLRYAEMSR